MSVIKNYLSALDLRIKSTKIEKKVVVFESDDWGSIRMPLHINNFDFQKLGINLERNVYTKFDILESESDVFELLKVLKKYTDFKGNHPKITLNYVVGNPDFEKIKSDNYKNYYFEEFPITYQRYYPNNNTLNLVKKATEENLVLPQFHGREHVNASYWLQCLNEKDPVFLKAFENSFYGITPDIYSKSVRNIQAVFDFRNDAEYEFSANSLKEGLFIFEKIFKFKSKSIIPNNYIWHPSFNSTLVNCGIEFIQGGKKVLLPLRKNEIKRRTITRGNGKYESNKLISLVRNIGFEPSFVEENHKKKLIIETVQNCKIAFSLGIPAVISIHRINFVSGKNNSNRTENLILFENLLQLLIEQIPDIEFWDTTELGNYYQKKENDSTK